MSDSFSFRNFNFDSILFCLRIKRLGACREHKFNNWNRKWNFHLRWWLSGTQFAIFYVTSLLSFHFWHRVLVCSIVFLRFFLSLCLRCAACLVRQLCAQKIYRASVSVACCFVLLGLNVSIYASPFIACSHCLEGFKDAKLFAVVEKLGERERTLMTGWCKIKHEKAFFSSSWTAAHSLPDRNGLRRNEKARNSADDKWRWAAFVTWN